MMTPKMAIEVEGLVKKFGQFVANDHLTFSVRQGEIFGFLGANGAGKTTAIRILCGLSKPSSGKVMIAGYDAMKDSEKIKLGIGYMCQRFSLYEDLTVVENMRLFGGIYQIPKTTLQHRIEELIQKLGIEELRNRLIGTLPLGWKQKLAFSVSIMHHPSIVFLDEPTGGVDPVTRRQFWDMIYEASKEGITVFVTTHYMDEAEYCDRVCILSQGRIEALGKPGELKQQFSVGSMDELFVKIAGKKEGSGV